MDSDENSVLLCFPLHNSSCVKAWRPHMEYILMYIFVSGLSSLTVFLNLLLVISICHFKQLHTPTNLIILSLAVADLLTGLIVIPVDGITSIETCWYFGNSICSAFPVVLFTILTGSLSSIFLISLDRYIAVTDPFHYTVKVTLNRTLLCVLFGWLYGFIYAVAIFNKHIQYSEMQNRCHGECSVTTTNNYLVFDFIFGLILPICIISYFYLRIFFVVRHQTKIINTVAVMVESEGKDTSPTTSATKAAKKLGVLVAVYCIYWMPYAIGSLLAEKFQLNSTVYFYIYWLMYTNSCINPLIYALLYPWFRISVKHILTLSIFNSNSHLNIFPERQ